MVKRRKRDAYGNWVWEDDEDVEPSAEKAEHGTTNISTNVKDEELSLDWKDFFALSIASLETFLLPVVIFILVLLGIVVGLSFFR